MSFRTIVSLVVAAWCAAGMAGCASYEGGAYGYGSATGYAAETPAAPRSRDDSYCARHYRSYDPASGTYLGYDGVRHSCP